MNGTKILVLVWGLLAMGVKVQVGYGQTFTFTTIAGGTNGDAPIKPATSIL
jgi:hypothetical protein